ncbi:MAG: flagellar biosynthetic protein FliR [Steroidobacteraceae bacterium]
MTITANQLTQWIGLYLWPFLRIAGCLMVAPVFGAKTVPAHTKLMIAAALTVLLAPLVKSPENIELLSGVSLVIALQQMLIGIALGFAVQIIFDAVVMGGQLVANSMGLSFAMNVDPLHGTSTPVLGQFYMIIVTLTFLALNGHLVLIESLLQSFTLLPVGTTGLGSDGLWMLVNFGSTLFSGALMIALPGMAAMLIVNFGFGIMSRAAPTLNLFAVGFPATLALGLIIVVMGLPAVQNSFIRLLSSVWMLLTALTSTAGG